MWTRPWGNRWKVLGSSRAGTVPSKVKSKESPHSLDSQKRRTFFKPSITSKPKGPTLEFIENASEGSPNEETKASIDNIKRMQDKTIGAIYDLVRNINDQIGEFAEDVLDESEETVQAASSAQATDVAKTSAKGAEDAAEETAKA